MLEIWSEPTIFGTKNAKKRNLTLNLPSLKTRLSRYCSQVILSIFVPIVGIPFRKWYADTHTSFGLRTTWTIFPPFSIWLLGNHRNGRCVFRTRGDGNVSRSFWSVIASSWKDNLLSRWYSVVPCSNILMISQVQCVPNRWNISDYICNYYTSYIQLHHLSVSLINTSSYGSISNVLKYLYFKRVTYWKRKNSHIVLWQKPQPVERLLYTKTYT